MTNNSLAVGDRVQIRDQYRGQPTEFCFTPAYGIEVGDTATVVEVFAEAAGDSSVAVEWDRKDARDDRTAWGSGWFDKAEEAAPQRPLVHFDDEKAGRDRSAAREAARLAISTTLKGEHNVLLGDAAAGESVDAYALNEAVTAAMRSATTRLGQSSGRRAMAKQFAHLGHIVQAVLENHADNLPGYQSGERSRVVQEAKVAVTEAAEQINNLLSERTTLTQAASDERRRLCEEIDNLKSSEASAVQYSQTLQGNLAQTVREANEMESAIEWVISRGKDKAERESFRNAFETFRAGFRAGADV